MDQTDTVRVVTTMPLEIDRAERPAGTTLELSAAEAQAMVDAGRARKSKAAKPADDAGDKPSSDPEPAPSPRASTPKKEG